MARNGPYYSRPLRAVCAAPAAPPPDAEAPTASPRQDRRKLYAERESARRAGDAARLEAAVDSLRHRFQAR